MVSSALRESLERQMHGFGGIVGVASWEWRHGSGVMGVAYMKENRGVDSSAVLPASLGFGGVPGVLAALRECWRRR